MDKMRIVLDTNILLSSVSKHSPYHLIMQQLREGGYILCVTTEVLLEYEEKLSQNFSPLLAELTMGALLLQSNIVFVDVFVAWQLIPNDPDDNKFVNCALWGDAHYLVSNDRHFRILKTIDFPKINLLTIDEFLNIIV
jgi:uncharacterized protein